MRLLTLGLLLALGCRGSRRDTLPAAEIARLVDSLRPAVEHATGLRFRGATRSAMKTRDEVHAYLVAKLEEDFPPGREQGIAAAYRLLGLIPDTLNLRALLLDLYTEQVAGFYDPHTATLYGVLGADAAQLRLVLAHELVHALQDQYLPLDSILKVQEQADRQTAAQAVLEGQATLASIKVLTPGLDVTASPQFWELYRQQLETQQAGMKVFSRTPLALRRDLIFPYLEGAEFMRWWDSARAGTPLPTVATLPRSTEQILFPARYAAGDQPIALRFADSSTDVLYEDTFGEFDIRLLGAVLSGGTEVPTTPPLGWGGDRFRTYRTPEGPALVWYIAWDAAASAARFQSGAGARLLARHIAGYRIGVDAVAGRGWPLTRIVIAPSTWRAWAALPLPAPR